MTNKQNDPRISVVIPNYNHAAYLGRALDSVCQQDLPPFEVLVLDDCSTDNSMEVIQPFVNRYPFVKVLRYPEKSKNWLLAYCEHLHLLQGDYIHSLGADDLIYPGFYRVATEALRQCRGAGVVFSNWYVINAAGQVRGQAASGFQQACFLREEPLKQQLCKPNFFEGGVASVIRRDTFLWLVGLRLHELGPWLDSMGFSVAAWKHGAIYLPQTFGGFTVHEKGGYNDSVVADDARSVECFERVCQWLRHPDVQSLVPVEILNAFERKVFGRFSPTGLQAWLSVQGVPQARTFFQSGQWVVAGTIYQRMALVEPNRAEAFAGLGACLTRLGRTAEAESALMRALTLNSQQSGAHAYLGICYQVRGQFADALFCFRRAVELDPPSAETCFRLGDTLERLQQFGEAAEAYRRAAELNPGLTGAAQKRDQCLTKASAGKVS